MSRIRTVCQFIAWAIPRWLGRRREDDRIVRAHQKMLESHEKVCIASTRLQDAQMVYDVNRTEYLRLREIS